MSSKDYEPLPYDKKRLSEAVKAAKQYMSSLGGARAYEPEQQMGIAIRCYIDPEWMDREIVANFMGRKQNPRRRPFGAQP